MGALPGSISFKGGYCPGEGEHPPARGQVREAFRGQAVAAKPLRPISKVLDVHLSSAAAAVLVDLEWTPFGQN